MKSPLDDAILAARVPNAASWRKLDEMPFDFERRRVSVLLERDGERRLLVKGAPEDILRLSDRHETIDGKVLPLDEAARRAFAATFDALGGEGYRALGIATRLVGPDHPTASVADEASLVFSGFAVFLDPPKASAGATIKSLRTDGVTVKLLTGDNEKVARHAFREIGVEVTSVLTGDARNMFSMAEAALFLPFLPMLPIQVLLNNLLYDLSQTAIPFDRVDKEATERPTHWNLGLIQRFMLVFGPVSSLFDFLTFYALLHLFGAGEALGAPKSAAS